MIRNIFVTLLVSLLSLHPVFSKDFRVNVNYLVFHIPDETSYLECFGSNLAVCSD